MDMNGKRKYRVETKEMDALNAPVGYEVFSERNLQ